VVGSTLAVFSNRKIVAKKPCLQILVRPMYPLAVNAKYTDNREVFNGWKEIANYLGKGVRTVQRYERALRLPVRRPAGKAKGSVLAIKAELDLWVLSGQSAHLGRCRKLFCELLNTKWRNWRRQLHKHESYRARQGGCERNSLYCETASRITCNSSVAHSL
jgi:hypothetical protein